jgi:probable ribonuclease FAU-1
MITLRIRGLYAAALTALFRRYSHVCEIVQPDDAIQARLPQAWRMDSPDVTIDDQPEARGNRDTLRVAGPADAVEQILQLLQEHCFDVFIRRESSQLGATYMGLVGAVSRVRRRAIVYMGEQRAGILPLRYDDRELRVGSYIPVRIEAMTTEGDARPQLSTVITVAGQYAVLTSAEGVKLSKQISDTATRERLQELGEAQATGGWGILWRTAAQHAEEPLLVQEITHLAQAARDLQARIAAATTVGYLHGGDMVAQVFMQGHAKAVCDALRTEIMPTLPGHHKYKAQGDMYGAIVDALEKELPPEVLRTRTASLNVLSSIDAMQLPIHSQLRFLVRDLAGSSTEAGEGQRLAYDLEAGWVDVREALLRQEDYPPDLSLDKQPGDYAVTRFQEGQWSYVTRFYGRDGTWKADYASITTPIAIFSDQLHLSHLHVTVKHSPLQPPEMTGLEALQDLQRQRVVSAALTQKVQEEGEALLRQWSAAAAVQNVPPEPH